MTPDTTTTPDTVAAKIDATENHVPAWHSYFAIAALILAIVAWAVLLWSNGYVACAVAAVAVVCGFLGAHAGHGALRNAAVTAIIAGVVLLVVVSAFLVVLKIGLS